MLSLNIVRLGGTLWLLHFSRYKKPLVGIKCLHIIHKHKVPFKDTRKSLSALLGAWLIGPAASGFPTVLGGVFLCSCKCSCIWPYSPTGIAGASRAIGPVDLTDIHTQFVWISVTDLDHNSGKFCSSYYRLQRQKYVHDLILQITHSQYSIIHALDSNTDVESIQSPTSSEWAWLVQYKLCSHIKSYTDSCRERQLSLSLSLSLSIWSSWKLWEPVDLQYIPPLLLLTSQK